MNPRTAIFLAALLGGSAVAMGAYHAHGLEAWLTDHGPAEDVAKRLDQAGVSVRYQMIHALALAVVGLLVLHKRSKALSLAAWCCVVGVLLFSGGLYLIVFSAPWPLTHPALVPCGGLTLIVGWCALAVHARALPK